MLAEGEFNLRKFITSSGSLQERVKQDRQTMSPRSKRGDKRSASVMDKDVSYAKKTFEEVQVQGEYKVLGVSWKPVEDQLVFDLSGIAALVKELKPTERSIVGIAPTFYDPLRFASPVTVQFKMLCVSKIPIHPCPAHIYNLSSFVYATTTCNQVC